MSKLKGDPGYRGGWCIHYRAPRDKIETCEAGISYGEFHGTKFAERPCFLDKGQSRPNSAPCASLRRPTTEEMDAHETWANDRMEMLTKVMVGITPWRAAHKGRSAQEVVECPACKGRLHLSIAAYNGHVHGHCETDGCASWME